MLKYLGAGTANASVETHEVATNIAHLIEVIRIKIPFRLDKMISA